MPDTPLHSSETPRSSSLYQPESEEEVKENGDGNEQRQINVADDDSDISEDCEKARYSSDFEGENEDIAEEISDDE